jgi:peptidoglycan hydrolase CwlO-like protein
MCRRKLPTRHPATLAVVLLLALAAGGAGTHLALAQDPGTLRHHIDRQKGRERQLASAAARLGRLEQATSHAVDVMAGRLTEAQGDLAAWEARLARTQQELRVTRARLVRLRARLAESRRALATMLRQRYTADQPDVVTVVLDAKGFADVLERIEFLRRVQHSDTMIVDAVRRGRNDARHDERILAALEPRQREQTAAVRSQRDALARMTAALQSRRAALAQARAARLAALSNTRASRRRAQRELSRLLAAQARAAASHGPGGPWAIPWPIVECESGGQNLPPNAATASGYYQMLDSTWHGLGGSTPHAYQASKAEQDRLAARLWAGGAGARNWVCAALVGA